MSRTSSPLPGAALPIARFDTVRWRGPLARKITALAAWLRERESVLVAYSGGVDSSFLAAMAVQALGRRAWAVTADSPSLPRADLREARALARRLGIRHRVIATAEMEDPAFVANPPDRCYHCKRELFASLSALADREGFRVVVDGSNTDDLGDFRPGSRAAAELDVQRPLQVLGFSKADIRAASRRLGLPTAGKPAAACLASRLPYGTPITEEALHRIEQSEHVLLEQGFAHCRARLHGEVVRIEVPPRDMARLLKSRETILRGLKAAGNRFVALDLQGYRTGSLNESLPTRP